MTENGTPNSNPPLLQWKQLTFFDRLPVNLPYEAYATSPFLQYTAPTAKSGGYESFGDPSMAGDVTEDSASQGVENADSDPGNTISATGGMMSFLKRGFLGLGMSEEESKGAVHGNLPRAQPGSSSSPKGNSIDASRTSPKPSPGTIPLPSEGPNISGGSTPSGSVPFHFPPAPPRLPALSSSFISSSSNALLHHSGTPEYAKAIVPTQEYPTMGFLNGCSVTAWTSDRGILFHGDSEGYLYASGPSSVVSIDPMDLQNAVSRSSEVQTADDGTSAHGSQPGSRRMSKENHVSFSAPQSTLATGEGPVQEASSTRAESRPPVSPPAWIHTSFRPSDSSGRVLCMSVLPTEKENAANLSSHMPEHGSSARSSTAERQKQIRRGADGRRLTKGSSSASIPPSGRVLSGKPPKQMSGSVAVPSQSEGNSSIFSSWHEGPSPGSSHLPIYSDPVHGQRVRWNTKAVHSTPLLTNPHAEQLSSGVIDKLKTYNPFGGSVDPGSQSQSGRSTTLVLGEQDSDTTPLLYVVQFDPVLALLDSCSVTSAALRAKSAKTAGCGGRQVTLPGVTKRKPFQVVKVIRVAPPQGSTKKSERHAGLSAIATYELAPSLHAVSLGFADGSIMLLKGDFLTMATRTVTDKPVTTPVFMFVDSGWSSPPTAMMVPPPGTPLLYAGPATVDAHRTKQASNPVPAQMSTTISGILGTTGGSGSVKQRVIHEDPHGNVVTKLAFADKDTANDPVWPSQTKEDHLRDSNLILYATTTGQVLSFTNLDKDVAKEVLDHQGCALNCATISKLSQHLVLGRPEAVYVYNLDGRGPCFVIQGSKTYLLWFKQYLVMLCEDPLLRRSTVTIHDLRNKYVAYTGHFSTVKSVFVEWGAVVVVTDEGKVFRLEERDIWSKLEILIKKELYPLAIVLARNNDECDKYTVAEVFRRYGEFLHSKNDFEGATQQFVQTIGVVEASHVIRKFLDSQLIQHLTDYLQALHEQGYANGDHTTLLLNCYTKLRDLTKLDEFLKSGDEVTFDVETAIKVCRQAGYCEHALYLAEKFEGHDWYLTIQIEDAGDYTKALEYMGNLPMEEAGYYLKKYGNTLIPKAPADATDLLIRLSIAAKSGYATAGSPKPAPSDSSNETRIRPEEFIHLYKPDQSEHLTKFLESAIEHELTSNKTVIYNSLLELYLSLDQSDEKRKRMRYTKVMEILQNERATYDVAQAMALCNIHQFKAGLLYLYERENLYRDILQLHIDAHDDAKVLGYCLKSSDRDPYVWTQVLTYFCEKREDVSSQIQQLLTMIENQSILTPLQVTQILTNPSSTVKLGTVKAYLVRRLRVEAELIQEDIKLSQGYQEETTAMRTEIEALTSRPVVFQVTSCTACQRPLEIPAVHFLCRHSYHLSCLNDSEQECPKCSPKNRMLMEIKRGLEASNEEAFYSQLEDATEDARETDDGFKVVAEWFSKKRLWKTENAEP